MRALILVAGAALAVSACSSNEAADNTMNVDENLAVMSASSALRGALRGALRAALRFALREALILLDSKGFLDFSTILKL